MAGATISDIAQQAGVSKSTVSNYLNARFGSMSNSTMLRIEQVIKETKYIPALSARRLASKETSRTICVVIPADIQETKASYYTSVIKCLGELSKNSRQKIILYYRNEPIDDCVNYLAGMHKAFVDGFIIYDLSIDDNFYSFFNEANIPYVCVGKPNTNLSCSYVATNHAQTINNTVDYLLSLGHTSIALIHHVSTGSKGVVENIREKTFLETLIKNSISYRNNVVINIGDHKEVLANESHKIKELLTSENRPTAVIITQPVLDIFLRITSNLNIEIPGDLSLIVIEYAESFIGGTQFTHVKSHPQTIARKAFRLLQEKIVNTQSSTKALIINQKIVVGNTTTTKNGLKKG